MSGKSAQIRESVVILITVVFILLLISFKGTAQNVGIGSTSPHISAQLDVSSTSKGILIPRMITADRNATCSPAHSCSPVPDGSGIIRAQDGWICFNISINQHQY